MVNDGKSGFIINLEYQNHLTEVLYKYLGTSKLKEMSKFIENYKKKFSWEHFLEGIESIYNKI